MATGEVSGERGAELHFSDHEEGTALEDGGCTGGASTVPGASSNDNELLELGRSLFEVPAEVIATDPGGEPEAEQPPSQLHLGGNESDGVVDRGDGKALTLAD